MSNISAQYPSDINNEEYKNRSIIIHVRKAEDLMSGDKIKQKMADVASEVTKTISETVKGATDLKFVEKKYNTRSKIFKAETIYTVCLPLPNELNDSQNHGWTEEKSAVHRLTEGALGSVNKILGELASQTSVRKPLVNPGYFQNYEGSTPREFTFTWDLIPRNPVEAANIISIVYNMKKFTLPTAVTGGIGLLSPFFFDIKVQNPHINGLMNMQGVVCTNLSVNYSADNSLQFNADGMPKYMTLSMSFTERQALTAGMM